MKLADLQNCFQDALLSGSVDVLSHIPDSPRQSNDVLFGVYRDAYVLRLLGLLREDFERLHTYLGDDAFDDLARDFIAAHPSRTLNARYFSQDFPAFVAAYPLLAQQPLAVAVARLEGALNDIFDCADATPATLADLSSFPPEAFANLTFVPHPSAIRLDLPAGLDAAFAALSQNEPPPPLQDSIEPQRVVVWRKEMVPHYRVLSTEEAMMWDEAAKGVRFGVLCEMLATYDDPENAALRAAQYLQSWLTSGLLQNIELRS